MEAPAQKHHCKSALVDGETCDNNQCKQHEGSVVTLHPSIRFYCGMWSLTQLMDPVFEDVAPSTDARSGDKASSPLPYSTAVGVPSESSSRVYHGASLSVVSLHQTLLPPAAVKNVGEVADESYAVRLASSDGLEFLRLHWHLLLPLLFPCCRWCGAGAVGTSDAAFPGEVSNTSTPSKDQYRPQEGRDALDTDAEASSSAEGAWSASKLYEVLLRQPLLESDLVVVREPGLMDRVYYSYVVFLRFFGWRVHEEERGVLDRHRAWKERYTQLELYRTSGMVSAGSQFATETTNADRCDDSCSSGLKLSDGHQAPAVLPPCPPMYHTFNFYESGLPRVLRCLLDIGFLRLAVRLVEFLLEEMSCSRLLCLLPLVESTLLSMIIHHPHVDSSHKTRLKTRLYRLTHSDSD